MIMVIFSHREVQEGGARDMGGVGGGKRSYWVYLLAGVDGETKNCTHLIRFSVLERAGIGASGRRAEGGASLWAG